MMLFFGIGYCKKHNFVLFMELIRDVRYLSIMKLGKIITNAILSTLVLQLVASPTKAYWSPPERAEFKSSSGKYLLEVIPPDRRKEKSGYCKASLFEIVGDKPKEIWSRFLINPIRPVTAFVADSGKYVVTMDEWGENDEGGEEIGKFPVVIYGEQGELIKVHSIETLDLYGIGPFIQSMSRFWWNENSISFFGPEEEYFFIRLQWGRTFVIELRTGRICVEKTDGEMDNENYCEVGGEKWKDLQAYAIQMVKEIVLSKLNSEDPDERKRGALFAGQQMVREAIPRLKELLSDKAYYEPSGEFGLRNESYVSKSAREALKKMGVNVFLLESRKWFMIILVVMLLLAFSVLCLRHIMCKKIKA